MIFFQSLTKAELAELVLPLSKHGDPAKAAKQARYRAQQIFHWVYKRYVTDWDLMSDLSKDMRVWLKANVQIYRLEEKFSKQAQDGTHKFYEFDGWKNHRERDHSAALQEKSEADVEVEMEDEEQFSGRKTDAALDSPKWARLTACISSQVGCAMACKFCLTGVQGLDRHLQTHEIVTQVHELRMISPITNIVFMGMGEPLHNFDHVTKACQILLDQDGMDFSKRKVTVSTSGWFRRLGNSVRRWMYRLRFR